MSGRLAIGAGTDTLTSGSTAAGCASVAANIGCPRIGKKAAGATGTSKAVTGNVRLAAGDLSRGRAPRLSFVHETSMHEERVPILAARPVCLPRDRPRGRLSGARRRRLRHPRLRFLEWRDAAGTALALPHARQTGEEQERRR